MSVLDVLYTILIMPLGLSFEVIYVIANNIINDPGLSIIALSLTMNILVLPLYMRADKMQEKERDTEARLRKGVAHIRKTFSGDEKAMMLQTYYRQNNYRPTDVFKGSVSLLLEIPFFIAAYMFLSNLQTIQGVSFWIIPDLGAPDGLLHLGDITINLLPFIMTALNIISCLLFTKGMPLKTKIQLYGMALFFLVFLYSSPSGLVFYWTLNNLFALIKTIFYKIKNPKLVLMILGVILGVGLIVLGIFFPDITSANGQIPVIIIGAICVVPACVTVLKKGIKFRSKESKYEPSKMAFLMGALLLALLTGVLIPTGVIAASPQEFMSIFHFTHPLWFVVKSGCLAFGAFVVWGSVFYWLCNRKAKLIFETVIWAACCIAIVDYLLFGTSLGLINPSLQYEVPMAFTDEELLINIAAVAGIILLAALIARFARMLMSRSEFIVSVVIIVLSVMNIMTINDSIAQATQSMGKIEDEPPSFELSREGKNVVVLMLDRGMNEYVPYILNEKPELKQKFAGFTYYDNVISFGSSTNFGLPGVFGGYEYTPEEINKRDQESLESKHDEALKVMPAIFDGAGYNVTVCDPTYAGYQWIPDLSIYNDYPDIDTYVTKGYFTDSWPSTQEADMRNFFCYSITKASPLFAEPLFYDNGNYNSSKSKSNTSTADGQSIHQGNVTADGINPNYLNTAIVLDNLSEMTHIVDGDSGNFLMMTNDTTHEPTLLQQPNYELTSHVDNSSFVDKYTSMYRVNGKTLRMSDNLQVTHYHVNMSAFLKIGDWLDYLRANGVYDNTRIILVADHGYHLNQLAGKLLDDGENSLYDTELYYPLLMVKDFNSKEFTTSHEFMTNADTPTLALNGAVENPTNPFTGKAINNIEKTAHDQHVFGSDEWNVDSNNGNTFSPDGVWFSVRRDMRDLDNWKKISDPNIKKQN